MKFIKNTTLALTLSMAFAGHAVQQQANMNVSVSVTQACSIQNVTDSTWSAIDGNFTASANSSSGSVTVLCTESTPYSIGLNNGSNYNGTNRTMIDGNNHSIAYDLYQDNAYSVIWGDIGSGNQLNGAGSGVNQSATVYAQIPSGQSPVPSGSYSDVVVVTLNF
jgi:spore coat protein U-like protein